MPTSPLKMVLQRVLADVGPDGGGMTDGELLTRFLSSRDDNALPALVRRHAPMVWGVCCRLLHNHQDAEDAFQATFLVLVRKATGVPRLAVANWLYGVARQTAVRLRALATKRGRRETQVLKMPEPIVTEVNDTDLQSVLDEELGRLPGHYRGVIVLCDLEGLTRKEAARQLGIPEGSAASRLARARALLAKRLTRRGIVFSGGSAAAVLSASSASASAPPALVASTIKAASLLEAGRAAGVISAKVAVLTESVVKAMFLSKLKTALGTMVLVGLGVMALAYGVVAGMRVDGSGRSQTEFGASRPQTELAIEAPNAKPKAARRENLRVLLVARGPGREYQFVRTLFQREARQSRLALSLLLQTSQEQNAGEGVVSLTDFPGGLGKDAPGKKGMSLSNFDVLIAFDADWSKLSAKQLKALEEWVSVHAGGVLFVAGPVNTYLLARDGGRDLKPLVSIFPVVVKDGRLPLDHDASRPYALNFKAGDSWFAGWNSYFWNEAKEVKEDIPQRGFYSFCPVERLKPASVVLATFAGPKKSQIDGQPFLVSMPYGRGKTMYLGSGETWRLRQFKESFHENFWLNVAHYLAGDAPKQKHAERGKAKAADDEAKSEKPKSVDNPLFHLWPSVRGTKVQYARATRITGGVPGGNGQVLKSTVSYEVFKVTPTELTIKVGEDSFAIPAKIIPNSQEFPKLTGKEDVKIGDKTFSCKVYRYTTTIGAEAGFDTYGLPAEITVWVTPEVPGGVVRRQISLTIRASYNIEDTLISSTL
jgi:RNA polymerase sigma factor (sigma-70 family)